MTNEVDDYGIKNNLRNISSGINKTLKLNNNLIEENNNLKEKIKNLELNIDTLIKNNENLSETLYILNKEGKSQINNIDNTENISYLLPSIKKILSIDDKNIENNFLKYILTLTKSIIKDEENQIRDEDTEILVLEIIKTLYETIDEDLLMDFTRNNHLAILEMIEDQPDKLTSMIVKTARILYSLEEFVPADDYILLLKFDDLQMYLKNEDTIIELILIYIHLVECNSMEDIEFLWSKLSDTNNVECRNIKSYIEIMEEVEKVEEIKIDKCIKMLNVGLKDIAETNEEVKCTIRLNSYVFMLEQLKEMIDRDKEEFKIENKLKNNKNIKSNEKLVIEYFDHNLYRIKNNKRICPFDTKELRGKNIVEKIYENTSDLNKKRNPKYKEIRVLYCPHCEEHFISKKNQDNIEGFIKVIKTSKEIIDNDDSFENEYNLNEISPLKMRGYHTGLGEDERWEILRKRCIPAIGRRKVISYLEGFIIRFSRQEKDYSNAIRIWESDIIKVRESYR